MCATPPDEFECPNPSDGHAHQCTTAGLCVLHLASPCVCVCVCVCVPARSLSSHSHTHVDSLTRNAVQRPGPHFLTPSPVEGRAVDRCQVAWLAWAPGSCRLSRRSSPRSQPDRTPPEATKDAIMFIQDAKDRKEGREVAVSCFPADRVGVSCFTVGRIPAVLCSRGDLEYGENLQEASQLRLAIHHGSLYLLWVSSAAACLTFGLLRPLQGYVVGIERGRQ